MKSISLFLVCWLIISSACTGQVNKNEKAQKSGVAFGIYETIMPDKLPVVIMDSLLKMGLQDEKDDHQPILGYMNKMASADLHAASPDASVKLIKTFYTVDNEHKYHGVVAVKPGVLLDNSAIQKAVQTNNTVEIRFNMEGAKAWAEITRNNTGKTLAFVIDDEIYSLPYINAEIRMGMARIDGFESEEMARKIADGLNAKQ
jgi:preprotein translocase subunit SecD